MGFLYGKTENFHSIKTADTLLQLRLQHLSRLESKMANMSPNVWTERYIFLISGFTFLLSVCLSQTQVPSCLHVV